MKKIILLCLLSIFLLTKSVGARSVYYYVILANINDDKLVLSDIDGTKVFVEAKSYCFGFDEDVTVISTNDLSSCTTSVLIQPRSGKTCEVWCQ